MAGELSSNWKKLQAKIKAESSAVKPAPKRKASEDDTQSTRNRPPPKKRQKSQPPQPKPAPKGTTTGQKKPPAPTSTMGNTQSSKPSTTTPKLGVSPSLSLWAADNGISSEALAEAYGLGLKDNSMLHELPARPNEGLAPDVSKLGKYLAIDCEMVGVGNGGHESALARVSVVDFHGKQVYDSYVRPQERVTDWRTHVSGIAPKHMAAAREFEEVQREVAGLLKDRILVGHDVKHDLQALVLDHSARLIRDTAKFSGFKKYGNGPKPALKTLAKELLGVEIQQGQHSSIEDARVAMLLFRKHKSAFDMEHANRFQETAPNFKGKSRPKAQKKRRN